MRVSILTSTRCRPIAEAHARHLEARYGASVEALYIGEDGNTDERIDMILMEWSELRLASGTATRFNDPKRVVRRIVHTAKSGDARASAAYVLVSRQGESKAVLVSDIEKIAIPGRPRMMGNIAPTISSLEVPQTGVVAHPGPELSDLCSKIVQSCLVGGVADRVCIRNLRVDHPAFDALREGRRLGAFGSIEPKIRWWASLLDPSTGARTDKHSRKTRAKLRAADRRLVNAFDGDAEFECVTEPAQVDDFARDASGIVAKTYQASLGIGVRDTEEYRAFLLEMAEAGGLRGYVMRGKGVPVAYAVGDRWGTTFTLWATSYLPEYRELSPGIVTLRRVMDSLAAEGVAKFDFGWGEAEYKQKLGDHHTDEADISLYAKRWLPTFAFMTSRAYQSAKSQTENLLAKSGARNRLKRIWRKKLTSSGGPGP